MKTIYKNKNIIGTDESGVGDYFTPLTGASVYLTYQQAIDFEKMGIKDSKLLSEKQINFFAMKIKELNQHELHFLSSNGYNKLNKFFNAHELKTLIHLTTINKLLKKVSKVDEIIIDKYVEEKK
jgi:ribonuclease HII